MTVVQTSGYNYTAVSGDTKPTAGVAAGTRLYETDTQTWYIFNGVAWFELAPETIAADLPNMPSDAQKDALDAANAPEADNPFATMADIDESSNLPTGGTTGQVLAKASNANFDTEWADGGGSIPDPLELGAAVFTDYVAVGASAAGDGDIRVPEQFSLNAMNHSGNGVNALLQATYNGSASADQVTIAGNLIIDLDNTTMFYFGFLPATDPGEYGQIWADSSADYVLKVSQG